jgi:hypothetical protein
VRWGTGGDRGDGGEPTYLVQAIVCAVLFNVVSGAVAIWFAVQTRRKTAAGDRDGAAVASRRARMWCWVSLVIGVVVGILIVTGTIPNPYG